MILRQKSGSVQRGVIGHPTFVPSMATSIALPGMWLYYTDPKSSASFTEVAASHTSSHTWMT